MRRSSSGAGPFRVRNDNDSQPRPQSRLSGDNRLSSGTHRLSTGSRSSFGGACKSRSSMSMGGPVQKRRTTRLYRMNDVRQDPRPTTDRQFKAQAIRNLIEFLASYSYPHPYSPKLLHSPQSKDFVHIFEFMYSLLEPGFKCKKIEEQFPQIMKDLGYPFAISKSAMYAIGSPHMWPNLLAALDWLREQIKNSLSQNIEELMFPPSTKDDFDGVPLSKIVFHHCTAAYAMYLDGADTFEDLEATLAKEISKNSAGGDMESLVHENRRLKIELESLEKEVDPLIEAQDKLAMLKQDHHRIANYSQQLEGHHNQLLTTLKSLEDEEKAMEAEFAVINADNEKKHKILSTQVFSQTDVERINRERQTLKQQSDSVERENEAIQNLIWEEERKIAKDTEKLSKKCTEYNQKARMLHLIPATEENAQGIDFEIRHTLEESQSHHFGNTIKPALNLLNNQEIDKLNELEKSRFHSQTILDQLSDYTNDKTDTSKSLEDKLHETDDKLERKKKTQQQELSRIQLEIVSIQDDMKELHTDGAPDVQCLQRDLHNEKKTLDQMRTDNLKNSKDFSQFMIDVTKLVVDHKTVIQEHLGKLSDESSARVQEEMKLDSMS